MRKELNLKTRNKKTNTGFKGISVHKASGKFETRVHVRDNSHSKNFYLGTFSTLPEAVSARNEFISNLL